jgi:catechol 2,3-dioxygenase-like lactoylglutathione lyase family enzyme
MSILGIDGITYGAEDLAACRKFFLDWGLKLEGETAGGLDFECLNGCEVNVRPTADAGLGTAIEAGATLRQVVWGAESAADIERLRPAFSQAPSFRESDGAIYCVDPNGLAIGLRVSRKRPVAVSGVVSNVWGKASRIDMPAPIYERAEPIEVGHVVMFTDTLEATTAFYESLGFRLSDRYPGRGHFLRCAPRGGHHDLFLLQTPEARRGLNHVAFTVRDIHEVFGGGLHVSRCGWETQLGPGRHPISSAYFWYFKSPAGALVEYYADEDELTDKWQPRDFEPGPTVFAEWAVAGGIDGNSRRQKSAAPGADGRFLTERR